MAGIMNAAQAVMAGYDTTLSRQWRDEDRVWRKADLSWRDREQSFMDYERTIMEEERAFRQQQMQQMQLDNARTLWFRFVEKNRRDLLEKVEQLKAVSNMAALLAGFALVAFLEFDTAMEDRGRAAILLPMFGISTALTVGLEASAVVTSTLILASILRLGAAYVSEQEEAEFMATTAAWAADYRLGDRPPAPRRSFNAHWAQRCEGEWRRAYALFSYGIPPFFANLAIAAWIAFEESLPASVCVTAVMAAAMLFDRYSSNVWSGHLLRQEQGAGVAAGEWEQQQTQEPAGLPWDWHQAPVKMAPRVVAVGADGAAAAAAAAGERGGRMPDGGAGGAGAGSAAAAAWRQWGPDAAGQAAGVADVHPAARYNGHLPPPGQQEQGRQDSTWERLGGQGLAAAGTLGGEVSEPCSSAGQRGDEAEEEEDDEGDDVFMDAEEAAAGTGSHSHPAPNQSSSDHSAHLPHP